jgi:AAA family ATP:ADP antiporter
MNELLSRVIASFYIPDRYERLKIILLTLTFLFVIAAYTIIYDLKHSIFMSVVGKEYVPWAKVASMIVLVPAILFYSLLVDKLRRYQLLYFYSILYGIFGLMCAYIIGHPTIGLLNTDSSPWRIFGWVYYFFVEGFSPFVLSVFWAFSNSISSPESAKKNYGILVCGSKAGGMLSAGFACWFLALRDASGHRIFSDVLNHQILMIVFSSFVIVVPFIVHSLMRKVPESYLHGYEAVYKFEKEKKKEETTDERMGLLSGLMMVFQRPYILGIFGMLFFYEVLNTILSYQRLGVVQSASNSVSDISVELYKQMFTMHFIGFFISLIGTKNLMQWLGEKTCLILIPITSGILLFYFWMTYTPFSLLLVFVTLKSLNYAFATPVRESLYIPTVKEVKFKSKSWIDAFGSKMARTFGSSFNILIDKIGSTMHFSLNGLMFLGIIVSWVATAFWLGNRYAKAIKKGEVIGS